MSNNVKLIRSFVFLVLASLLLVGCSAQQYNPGDDVTTDHTSRTFAISDVYPYPGDTYQIQDKQIGTSYSAYIYIINNGDHEKDMSAEDVKLTIIDETHLQTIEVGTTTIDDGVSYAVFNNLIPNEATRVHLHVEGYIDKNKIHELYASANSNSFNITVPPPVLQTLSITPANSTIQVGLTQTFTATANYSDGSTKDVSDLTTWSSSNVGKASMAGNVATGVSPGICIITASIGGKSGTANLTVTAPVLQSILVSPTNASVQIGQAQTFTAVAFYSNGSTVDVSNMATWSSSNQSVATISGGVATGVTAGSTTITAVYGGQAGTADLTVVVPPNQNSNDRLIWEQEIVDP